MKKINQKLIKFFFKKKEKKKKERKKEGRKNIDP